MSNIKSNKIKIPQLSSNKNQLSRLYQLPSPTTSSHKKWPLMFQKAKKLPVKNCRKDRILWLKPQKKLRNHQLLLRNHNLILKLKQRLSLILQLQLTLQLPDQSRLQVQWLRSFLRSRPLWLRK
jgi:hypothetical protein